MTHIRFKESTRQMYNFNNPTKAKCTAILDNFFIRYIDQVYNKLLQIWYCW
jgi:hypothetical protein